MQEERIMKKVRMLGVLLAMTLVMESMAADIVGAAEPDDQSIVFASDISAQEAVDAEENAVSDEEDSAGSAVQDDEATAPAEEEPDGDALADEAVQADVFTDEAADEATDEVEEAEEVVEEETEAELLGDATTGTTKNGGSYTLSADGKTLTLDGTGTDGTLPLDFYFTDNMLNTTIFDTQKVTKVTISNYKKIDSFTYGSHHWDELRTVIFSNGVEEIAHSAFNHIPLTSVSFPESLKKIGPYAFGYAKFKNITLPTSVIEIGDGCFNWNLDLETITLNNGLQTIGGSVFDTCPKLKDIVIPDTVTSCGPLGIGWNKYTDEDTGITYTESLETLTMPISAVEVETWTGYSEYVSIKPPFTTFKKLTFTKGTGEWPAKDEDDDNQLIERGIPEGYEAEDGSDYEVVFEEGITSVPHEAFMWDENLVKVTFPSTLTKIEHDAFNWCPALKEVIFKPGTGERKLTVEWDGFRQTPQLKQIDFPADVKELHMFSDAFCSWDESDPPKAVGLMDVYFRHPEVLLYQWCPDGEGSYYTVAPSSFNEGCTFHAYPYKNYKWDHEKGAYSVEKMVNDMVSWRGRGYYVFKSLGKTPKPTPAPKTVKVQSVTLSRSSVVKYRDQIDSRVELTAFLTPANLTDPSIKFGVRDGGDGVVSILTKSTEYDAQNGTYRIFASLNDKVGSDVIYVESNDSNSTVQYVAECRITIKERDQVLSPRFRYVSGSANENGALVELYSQTPYAQIFYTLDPTKVSELSAVTFHSGLQRYVSSSDAVKQYTSPLVIGEDITQDQNKIYACAYKPNFRTSECLEQEFVVPEPEDVWGEIDPEDQASEFEDQEENLLDENGLEEAYRGIWVPSAQLTDASLVYTGKAVTIDNLRVYYGTKLLAAGTDYTLKYTGNVNPGATAKLNLTLKGNYSGTETIDFTIGKCPVEATGISHSIVQINAKTSKAGYTAQKPDPKIVVKATGKTLKNGTDVKITYKRNGTEDYADSVTEPGIYSVRLENVDGSNYAFPGDAEAIVLADTIHCVGGETTAMSKATVSKIAAQEISKWKGAVEPEFTVICNGKTLTGKRKGADGAAHYTYQFVNNEGAGTATLYIIGTNELLDGQTFVGFKTSTFKINGIPFNARNIQITGIEKEYPYNGGTIDPAYTVKYGDVSLRENVDFTVAYAKNGHTNAGTVNMTFTGMGRFTGSLKQSFTITKLDASNAKFRDLSENDWKDEEQAYYFVKSGTNPGIRIYAPDDPERRLFEGADYTVKYTNNKAVGAYDARKGNKKTGPSATITFKGNYQGTKTLYYTIRKDDLSGGRYRMSLNDLVAATAPNKFVQKPVITDTRGNVLNAGTDYDKKLIYTYDEDVEVTYTTGKNKKTITESCKKGDEVLASHIIPAGAVIRVTANGINNFEGPISNTFTFVGHKITELKFSVKADKKFYYTGKPVTPQKDALLVQVKSGTKWVEADESIRDYFDIAGYTNNVKKGTATMTIRGKNGYAGTATVKFTILSPQ